MACVLILTLDVESGTYIGDVLRRDGYGVRVADPHSQPADLTVDTRHRHTVAAGRIRS